MSTVDHCLQCVRLNYSGTCAQLQQTEMQKGPDISWVLCSMRASNMMECGIVSPQEAMVRHPEQNAIVLANGIRKITVHDSNLAFGAPSQPRACMLRTPGSSVGVDEVRLEERLQQL
eukprot:5563883-Amphidinium_carterae.1